MRVLMLAIRYDVDDWATNFIPLWVERLATHVTQLDVLALEVGNTGNLPANVRVFSMGKEHQHGRLSVLAGFYRHALPLIAQADVVFVHMIPRYALLAAPIAMPLRKPILLWYTHRNPSADLRRALPLVRRVMSAVPSSFPLDTPKLRVLGHGIDPDFFVPSSQAPITPPMIVHVARLQPIKQQQLLIEALTHIPDAHAIFIGSVPQGENPTYADDLRQQAATLGVAEQVTFTGGLSATDVRQHYQQATIAVNLSPVGLFDKAALESMATGVPTLVTNGAFSSVLGEDAPLLLLENPTAETLAQRINSMIQLTDNERQAIGTRLRANVMAQHSLDALMPRLASVLETGEIGRNHASTTP